MATLQWPAQAAEAEELLAAGVPCLLMVATGAAPPPGQHPLADWERLPADKRDTAARICRLAARRPAAVPRPEVGDDRRLRRGERWVALSPTEARLARTLCARFDEVVTETDLRAAGSGPAKGPLSATALRVHLARLRRRIGEVDLTVRAIRGDGYVLSTRPPSGSGAGGPDQPRTGRAAERYLLDAKLAR